MALMHVAVRQTEAMEAVVLVVLAGGLGIGGSFVGARIQASATKETQQEALAAAEKERIKAQQDAAAAALAEAFGRVLQHIRVMPKAIAPWRRTRVSEEDRARTKAAEEEWGSVLDDLLAPAEVIRLTIRDKAVRKRLEDAINLLTHWQSLWYAYHNPGTYDRAWVVREVARHAVECVGAQRREEPLPEPSPGFTVAAEAWAEYVYIMEQQEEQERQQRDSDQEP